jgi:hypothetical protein
MKPTTKIDAQQLSDFSQQLAQHPELFERFQMLLGIVENADGDAFTADQAEQKVIEAIRLLGQRALTDWAQRKVQRLDQDYQGRRDLHRSGKKTLLDEPGGTH